MPMIAFSLRSVGVDEEANHEPSPCCRTTLSVSALSEWMRKLGHRLLVVDARPSFSLRSVGVDEEAHLLKLTDEAGGSFSLRSVGVDVEAPMRSRNG